MKKSLFTKKGGTVTSELDRYSSPQNSGTVRKKIKKRPKKKKETPLLPILCRPGAEMSLPLYIIGWALRSLVLFCGVQGLTLFIGDGIGCYGAGALGNANTLAIISFALTVIFSAAAWFRTLWFVPPILGAAAGIGILFTVSSNPFLLIWDGVRYVINTALMHMVALGYTSFGDHVIGNTGSYVGDDLLVLTVGFGVLATVIAVILAIALLRKVHTFIAVAMSVVVIVPVFMYNLTRGNAGVSLVLIFIFGELSLLVYERKFSNYEAKRIEKKEKRAAKKAAKEERRLKKKEAAASLDSAARKAYAIAMEVTGDKHDARDAKYAVYRLDRKEKAAKKKAAADKIKAEKKKAAAAKKAAKKELAAKKKADAAAAKKELEALKKLPKDEANRRIAAKNEAIKAEKKARDDEKREIRRKKAEKETASRKTLAASGFAGGTAVILAALAVWLPFAAITGNFITIDFINDPVSTIREYVTAYLRGDDIDLNNLGSIAELTPRTLTYDSPKYEQVQMLAVETERTDPVYLRGWVGMHFNTSTGTWTSADSDMVLAYRKQFGKTFTPDILKTYFLGNVFPTSVMISDVNPTMRFNGYGFDVRQINLRRINGSSLIIYASPTVNSDLGILGYGTIDKNDARYSAYFDGIYSSRFFNKDVYYSTVSFTTALNSVEAVGIGMDGIVEYFKLFLTFTDIIKGAESYLNSLSSSDYTDYTTVYGSVRLSKDDFSALDEVFKEECKNKNLPDLPGDTILARYLEMDESERKKMEDFVKTEEDYCKWADLNYGGSIYSNTVTSIAKTLLEDAGYERNTRYTQTTPVYFDKAGNRVNQTEIVMTVINYLKENYEYTLEPVPYEGDDMTVLDSFLSVTKNGYCTHFATAAAALLREYGYSVRYAEGYLVNEFVRDYSSGAPSKYRGYALDEDAHAWIEVYYPYIGWVAFETVPTFMEAMYDPRQEIDEGEETTTDDEGVTGTDVTENPDETKNPEEPFPSETKAPIDDPAEEEPPEEEPISQLYILLIAVICIAAAAIVIFVVRLVIKTIMKRAERVVSDRQRHIIVAMDSELIERQNLDTLPYAKEFDDTIFRLFKILGYPPHTGEQYSEYAARLEVDFGGMTEYPLSQIFELVSKTEFGDGLTNEELYILADFTNRLTTSAYAGLSTFERIKYRYLKRMI